MGNENDRNENCGKCGNTKEFDMVQCDGCDVWFCYECVNVTAEVENTDWMCDECTANQTIHQNETAAATKGAAAITESATAATMAATAATTTAVATTTTYTQIQCDLQQYEDQRHTYLQTQLNGERDIYARFGQPQRQQMPRVNHLGRYQVGQVDNVGDGRRISFVFNLLSESQVSWAFFCIQKYLLIL